jgi:ABC-type Zn2+ transport system substrate-binding protein/surface adhesin
MQEERKEDVEGVEAHKWHSPSEPEKVANQSADEGHDLDDEVEAHKWHGPQEFSKFAEKFAEKLAE